MYQTEKTAFLRATIKMKSTINKKNLHVAGANLEHISNENENLELLIHYANAKQT